MLFFYREGNGSWERLSHLSNYRAKEEQSQNRKPCTLIVEVVLVKPSVAWPLIINHNHSFLIAHHSPVLPIHWRTYSPKQPSRERRGEQAAQRGLESLEPPELEQYPPSCPWDPGIGSPEGFSLLLNLWPSPFLSHIPSPPYSSQSENLAQAFSWCSFDPVF